MKKSIVGKASLVGVESEQEPEENQLPESSRKSLRDLIYLGSLSDSFDFAGHAFVIRTLTEGQLLKASKLCAQYENTVGYTLAYKMAILAGAVESVDDEPLATRQGLSPKEDTMAEVFDEIHDWYGVSVDYVFSKWIELDKAAKSLAEELGKA